MKLNSLMFGSVIVLMFMFTGCGGGGGSSSSSENETLTLTVYDQTVVVLQDSLDNNITLTTNDKNSTLVYTIETNTTNGTLSGTAPNLTYTPNTGYSGSDSFTFKVNNGTVDSNIATISITVNPLENQIPVANAGVDQSVVEGDDVTLDASSSTDDGSIVSYVWSEGATQLSTDMSFTKNDFAVGTHTITLTVTDNQGATATDEVVVTVNAPANLAPTATDQNVTLEQDSSNNTIILSGSDADGDTLTYAVVTNPTNGTLSGTAPNLTYTPNAGYSGNDNFTFKVNDGTVDSNIATVGITVNAVLITHNGTTYGTVTSPYTSKIWLDRNLGASQACTALDDRACYGDYYQWGRDYDGHQESNSTTTTTQATDINNVGSSFITSSSTYSYDWAQSTDSDGTLRSANWSKTDGSSICPVGFRVPTTTELENETVNSTDGMSNNIDAFNNFLKLPSAGFRYYYNGSVSSENSYGVVWSSSVSGSRSTYLNFANDAYLYDGNRASGFSVRCIKD